jgi:uncharacterized protein (DUF362 family)
MVKVALVKGEDRYKNIQKALGSLEDELEPKIKKAKRIVIKPNFVSVFQQLAATHVEAIKAVLDFLFCYTKEQILIAENAALGNTFQGFANFGYLELEKDYNVCLFDLGKDKFVPFWIFDISGRKQKIGIAKTILDADLRISVTPMKTHDEMIVTLGLKNMIMGSIDKRALVHQGPRLSNLNIAHLAPKVLPHLCLIDGFLAMEGNGPVEGEPKKLKIALASCDSLACDWVGTRLMGFDPDDVGYLHFCEEKKLGETENIEIVGEKLEKCVTKFIFHRNLERQLQWKIKPTPLQRFLIPPMTKSYLYIQKMPFYNTAWFEKFKEQIKRFLGY